MSDEERVIDERLRLRLEQFADFISSELADFDDGDDATEFFELLWDWSDRVGYPPPLPRDFKPVTAGQLREIARGLKTWSTVEDDDA